MSLKRISNCTFIILAALIANIPMFVIHADPANTKDDYTCGKEQGITLAAFKTKLCENCDLTKPFSTSLSKSLNEETYFYCCRKSIKKD